MHFLFILVFENIILLLYMSILILNQTTLVCCHGQSFQQFQQKLKTFFSKYRDEKTKIKVQGSK